VFAQLNVDIVMVEALFCRMRRGRLRCGEARGGPTRPSPPLRIPTLKGTATDRPSHPRAADGHKKRSYCLTLSPLRRLFPSRHASDGNFERAGAVLARTIVCTGPVVMSGGFHTVTKRFIWTAEPMAA